MIENGSKSLVLIKNQIGPRTKPWGTQYWIFFQ